jgi:hypothetical protein
MASAHIDALTAKHSRLESSIAQEMQRPLPDSRLLTQLKKEKLRLKEELSRTSG